MKSRPARALEPRPELTGHLQQGMTTAWPICLGYFPLGLALGVLARQSGIPYWAVAMMSILVFAGSAQFICVAMLANGASILAIVFTTFVVNLRHALMSSALAVYLQGKSRWFLACFAYGITDESFAVNMSKFKQGNWNHWSGLALNQTSNSAWVIATVSGTFIGQAIPPGAFGIDYALPAMFLCLLIYQLQGGLYLLTALLTSIIAIFWYIYIPGNSYIIGASLTGATAGFFIKRRQAGLP